MSDAAQTLFSIGLLGAFLTALGLVVAKPFFRARRFTRESGFRLLSKSPLAVTIDCGAHTVTVREEHIEQVVHSQIGRRHRIKQSVAHYSLPFSGTPLLCFDLQAQRPEGSEAGVSVELPIGHGERTVLERAPARVRVQSTDPAAFSKAAERGPLRELLQLLALQDTPLRLKADPRQLTLDVYSSGALEPDAARQWGSQMSGLLLSLEHRDEGPRCPRCAVGLVTGRGQLHEDVCPQGHGRFLDSGAAERLLLGEEGFDRETLRELASLFAGKRLPCPGCTGGMSPVTLRGVSLDLCLGCGGLWLDDGELNKLSRGRHEELR